MRLLRREEPLDPDVARELEALEAALRDEPVGAEFADLTQLVETVRSDRPVPREAFLEALDRRVEQRFEDTQPERRLRLSGPVAWGSLRRYMLPSLAAAASLALVAVGVAGSGLVSGDGSGNDASSPVAVGEQDSLGGVSGSAAVPQRKQSAPESGATDAEALPSPELSAQDDQTRPRQVERSAQLTLGVPGGDIEDATDRAIAITDRNEGFVVSSSVSGGSEAQGGARLDLRIPSSNVQQALAELSKLGHVQQRTQNTQDITASFSSLRKRISTAQQQRRSLQRRIEAAGSSSEASALRTRLRGVQRRLTRLRAQQQRLTQRVEYSTLGVSIVADAGAGNDGRFTPGDALGAARDILGAMVCGIVIGLAVLAPAALILALVWAGVRMGRRRRREQALDSLDESA